MTTQNLQILIPVLTPLIVELVKLWIPKIPKATLPIVAVALGAGMELAGHYSGLYSGNALTGAFLGAVGVVLRDIADQVKKAKETQ